MRHERIAIAAAGVIALVTLLGLARAARGEHALRYEAPANDSKVRVDGTSTVHDWTVASRQVNGHIEFQVDVPKESSPQEVKRAILANPKATAQVEIPARSLKSDDKEMDKKMYDALRTKKHPLIKYQLTGVEVKNAGGDEQATFELATKGELTVAGTSRTLEMPMTVEVIDETQLKITGRTSFKMTDFNVKPPEALFGIIKSGDKISVRVEWLITRSEDGAAAAQ